RRSPRLRARGHHLFLLRGLLCGGVNHRIRQDLGRRPIRGHLLRLSSPLPSAGPPLHSNSRRPPPPAPRGKATPRPAPSAAASHTGPSRPPAVRVAEAQVRAHLLRLSSRLASAGPPLNSNCGHPRPPAQRRETTPRRRTHSGLVSRR